MSTQRIQLLLVDDRTENLVALETILDNPEYQLTSVRSGDQALKLLLRHDYALILMDVQMPGLDGFETARLIRGNPRTATIPIIFITAINKDERYVMRGYETGAVDYLFKPYDPDILRSKVAVFANLHRAKLELLRQAELLREHERAERRRATVELELKNLRLEQAAQARYRQLVDGPTHAMVWTLEPTTLACRFVSPSVHALLGCSVEQWLASPAFWQERVHPGDRGWFVDLLGSACADSREHAVEHRALRADGQVALFRTTFRSVPDEKGSGHLIHCFSVDVSEVRRGEEVLRFLARAGLELSGSLELGETARRVLALAVPVLADGCVLEVDGIELHPPAPMFQVLHRDPERCDELRALAHLPELAQLRTAGEPLYLERAEIERLLRGTQDREAPAAAQLPLLGEIDCLFVVPLTIRERRLGSLTFFRSARGTLSRHHDLALAEDLGRRAVQALDNAVLYQQARQAVRIREEFLSVASHELRTPLTVLSLRTSTLLRSLRDERAAAGLSRERLLRQIESVREQSERLEKLVDTLLDVSRMARGKLQLEPEEFDLSSLVGQVVEQMRTAAVKSGTVVTYQEPGPIPVYWDRMRFEQVLVNLLGNAIKYGLGRPVAVELGVSAGTVHLAVRDQGIGIAVEQQERIFDCFERAVTDRHYGGLGIGLWITREVLDAMGGHIALESRPGEGSTFIVEAPGRLAQPGLAVQTEEDAPPGAVISGTLAPAVAVP
jgi:signal transduction histidine kinase/DNA-binding response OmpR family regulator